MATSDVTQDVAATVLSLHSQSYEELMQVIAKTDKLDLTSALQDEFAPFVRSTGFHA